MDRGGRTKILSKKHGGISIAAFDATSFLGGAWTGVFRANQEASSDGGGNAVRFARGSLMVKLISAIS